MEMSARYRRIASWLHELVRWLWIIYLVGAVFSGALVLLALFASSMPIPFEVRLAAPLNGALPLDASLADPARDGLEVEVGASMLLVTITPAPLTARLLTVAPWVTWIGLWGVILHRLRALVGKLEYGMPFVPANGRRLVHIGLAALGLEACELVSSFADHAYVARLVEIADGAIAWGFDLDLPFIVLGLLLVVLGEAFRVGAFLQDEYDATA